MTRGVVWEWDGCGCVLWRDAWWCGWWGGVGSGAVRVCGSTGMWLVACSSAGRWDVALHVAFNDSFAAYSFGRRPLLLLGGTPGHVACAAATCVISCTVCTACTACTGPQVETDEFQYNFTTTEKPHVQNDTVTLHKRYAQVRGSCLQGRLLKKASGVASTGSGPCAGHSRALRACCAASSRAPAAKPVSRMHCCWVLGRCWHRIRLCASVQAIQSTGIVKLPQAA